METLRLSIFALVLFAAAFAGISWANKGFPMVALRATPTKPDARIPTFEQSIKTGIRKDWEASKTSQSDGDKDRDKLRLELWQAAIGYKLSPCDETMKKNLVAALTNYTGAWGAMAGCKAGTCSGDDDKLDVAAAAFKTPADLRVHKELREAFEQGGVTRNDFPKSVRNDVFMWTGMPFGVERPTCTIGRRAERTR
ncbi:MAG: hypothetical protein ACREDY_04995 [Bradyrhizobium sp.]